MVLIKRPQDIATKEITQESVFRTRRKFVQALGLAAATPLVAPSLRASLPTADEQLTPEQIVTSYNNFYEFGMDKGDPARYAHALTTDPWSVEVTGEAAKTGKFAFEDVIKGLPQEERVYRFRCVEAWSMVVPWTGIPMKQLLEQFQPNGNAKYVEFTTLHRPREMRGQGSVFTGIDWPYVEGLRMDEAYHPLAILAVGMYGEALPNQNGAPLRLVVPWKYGFKSIKSIVEIRLTRKRPRTSWEINNSREYGFFANVNPAVDHPRWSQKEERRLPSPLFSPNYIETQPFNGYGESVAGLYAGMDLRRNF